MGCIRKCAGLNLMICQHYQIPINSAPAGSAKMDNEIY